MQPLRLTLKGFRGIRDGLGRDEITLDQLPVGRLSVPVDPFRKMEERTIAAATSLRQVAPLRAAGATLRLPASL